MFDVLKYVTETAQAYDTEPRSAFRGGQLVQHGPGRPGYAGEELSVGELHSYLKKKGIDIATSTSHEGRYEKIDMGSWARRNKLKKYGSNRYQKPSAKFIEDYKELKRTYPGKVAESHAKKIKKLWLEGMHTTNIANKVLGYNTSAVDQLIQEMKKPGGGRAPLSITKKEVASRSPESFKVDAVLKDPVKKANLIKAMNDPEKTQAQVAKEFGIKGKQLPDKMVALRDKKKAVPGKSFVDSLGRVKPYKGKGGYVPKKDILKAQAEGFIPVKEMGAKLGMKFPSQIGQQLSYTTSTTAQPQKNIVSGRRMKRALETAGITYKKVGAGSGSYMFKLPEDTSKMKRTYEKIYKGEGELIKLKETIDKDINKLRPAFQKNPNIKLKDAARALFSDFDNVGIIKQEEYLKKAAQRSGQLLEALNDVRDVKNFRTPFNAREISKNMQASSDIFGRFGGGALRDFRERIADKLLEKKHPTKSLKKLVVGKGRALDEAVGVAATFKHAPGYIEASQFLKGKTNIKKGSLDKYLTQNMEAILNPKNPERFKKAKAYNEKAKAFKKVNPQVDVAVVEFGKHPSRTVTHYSDFSTAAKKNMSDLFKKTNVSFSTKSKPLTKLVKDFKKAKALPGKAKLIAFTALGLTTAGVAVADTNKIEREAESSLVEAGMLPEVIAKNPWTSAGVATAATATTKPGRSLLGKAFRTLGTPIAGPAFAAWNISDKMKAGSSLTDAIIDPLTGVELALPTMFKENVGKITKNPMLQKALSLGKFGTRFLGPIGWGITAAGLGKEAYKVLKEDKVRRESITPEQRRRAQREYFDKDQPMFAGGGIAGLSGGKRFGPPPESGPVPYGGGLSSQFNRVRKLTG